MPSDSYDAVDDLAFGPSILEKLFKELIAQKPNVDGTQIQRLNGMMKALTGNRASPWVLELADEPALLHMGLQWHRDRVCDLTLRRVRSKPRSNLLLARQAALRFLRSELDSDIRRLYEKFTGSYYSKQKSGKYAGVAFPETWIYRATQHDYMAESLEDAAVSEILAKLLKFGVGAN